MSTCLWQWLSCRAGEAGLEARLHAQVMQCPTCDGQGEESIPCNTCGGDGRVRNSKKISLRVPAGATILLRGPLQILVVSCTWAFLESALRHAAGQAGMVSELKLLELLHRCGRWEQAAGQGRG